MSVRLRNRELVGALLALSAGVLSGLAACADLPQAPILTGGSPLAAKAPPAVVHRAAYFWATGTNYGIRPDGRKAVTMNDTVFSEFLDGDCAIISRINLTNAGDSKHDPGTNWRRTSACSDGISSRRYETVVYPPALGWASEQINYLYIRRLYYFDNGSTEPIYANWRNTMDVGTTGGCGTLHFNETLYPGSSNLLISRTTVAGQPAFRVGSDPAKAHLAWCSNRNAAVSVPFLVIVQDLGPA